MARWLLASALVVGAFANSGGVGIPCNVDVAVGNAGRVKDTSKSMWWVLPPVFATQNQYTVRTGDGVRANDPTSYVPGEYLDIFIRTNVQDKQWTGIVIYAEDAAGNKLIDWLVDPELPVQLTAGGCVTHKNADAKPYLLRLKWKGPKAGTGTVKIKALVKFGLAFPVLEGEFYWPNAAHLTLTEGTVTKEQLWFEGNASQSCRTVCQANGNRGCDLTALQAVSSNPAGLLAAAGPYTSCTPPLVSHCGAHSPAVGDTGCFFHDSECSRPAFPAPWTQKDPCAGLSPWVSGQLYQSSNDCCTYGGFKWCAEYYTNGNVNPQQSFKDNQYGPWRGSKGTCMPAGGYPAFATIPFPATPAKEQVTCDSVAPAPAVKINAKRLCACTASGTFVTGPPTPRPTGAPVAATTGAPVTAPTTSSPTVVGQTNAPSNAPSSRAPTPPTAPTAPTTGAPTAPPTAAFSPATTQHVGFAALLAVLFAVLL